MNKWPSSFIAIIAALVPTLDVQAGSSENRLSLVEDGRATATIILPTSATQIEKSAAIDLQRCLQRMSGATLPIVAESKNPQGVRIEIGATVQGRRLREELSRAKHRSEEVSVIDISKQSVVMVGLNDEATGHAVYSLLERLGVRWLQPSLAWEIVPRRKTVSLPIGRQTLAPYFDRRGGLAVSAFKMDESWSDSTQSWARRNRMGGWDHIGNGHSYNQIVPTNQLAKHPEYFGLWQGRRQHLQLCTTNPNVIRLAIERARDDWCKNSTARLICISPNDGNTGFCECDSCAKLRFARGNHSDLIVELANQVARSIRDKYPNRYVTFYADYHCVGPPLKVKPEKNIVFWIPQWNVDRAQPLTHPRQERFRVALDSWSKFGNPIHLYLYYTAYNHWVYYPLSHCMRVDFPHFVKKGVRGVYSQSQANWGTQGLNLYLYARLAWDPSLDVDELITEFCELAYGPAAKTMLSYYKLLEEAAAKGTYYRMSDVVATFNSKVVAEADQLMAHAVRQVKAAVKGGADSSLLKRIEYVALAQKVMSLHLGARHALNRFYKSRKPELLDRAQRNYEEEIKILLRPENEYLIDKMFRKKLIDRLAVLKSRTVYGVGRFRYSDGYSGGGNSAIHAKRLDGFQPGQWGLNLYPRTIGKIVYRFEATKGGVFKSAILASPKIAFEKGKLNNSIEVGTPAAGGTKFVQLAENQNLENENRDFDLTKLVAGMPWFEIRISAHNRSPITRLSLISLSVTGEVVAKEAEIKHVVIEPATKDTPRSDTASVARLKGDRIMVVYHKYESGERSGHDHGLCRIWSKVSDDYGKTWKQPRLLIDVAKGDMNVQAPALLRTKAGEHLLVCLRAHPKSKSSTMSLFKSVDAGKTFMPRDPLWSHSKGQLLQGGTSSLLELRSGRLLLPYHGGVGDQFRQKNSCWCLYSDDGGKSWTRSQPIDLPKRGAMEGSVAQFDDGHLLMSLRTQLGGPFLSRSNDEGQTWSKPVFSELEGGESGTCLRRLPGSNDVVLFFNNSKFNKKHHHYGERTPLTCARSSDRGKTWRIIDNILADPKAEYTNLDCFFAPNGDAILTYMLAKPAWNRDRIQLNCALIPRGWFDP